MTTPDRIDLVELPVADAAALPVAQSFYSGVFGWEFTSYGPEYADTRDSGVAFGLNGSDDRQQSAPLAVLYVADLDATRDAVVRQGGRVLHDIYAFPGGRRFHFADPAGNELAAWSE